MSGPSLTTTTTVTHATVAPTENSSETPLIDSSSTANGVGSSSGIPSIVLLYLAVTVGAVIAMIFLFFTFRYFVRAKYGVYTMPRRRLLDGAVVHDYDSSSDSQLSEIQEQLDFIRSNRIIREQALFGALTEEERRRRRRILRGRRHRYSKMKKLSMREVELLFPVKTYYDWLHGGKERDSEQREDILREAEVETNVPRPSDVNTTVHVNDEAELVHTLTNITTIDPGTTPVKRDMKEIDITDDQSQESSENEKELHSLHFTSGSCAICLEQIEDEESVRGLICGHVFHSDCLDPWLTKRRACCPMCKRDYLFKRDYHNNEESNDNNNNNNTNAEEDEDDEEDQFYNLNAEELRDDPTLQAMLQELIPTSARVRILMNDSRYTHLNLEENATRVANRKYGTVFRVVWWKLMGISKRDFFNWAVLTLIHQYRQEHPEDINERTETQPGENPEIQPAEQQSAEQFETDEVQAEQNNESQGDETVATTEQPTDAEVDITEARSIVENRV